MSQKIMDGKKLAGEVKAKLAEKISTHMSKHPEIRAPGLAVILVGEDPASQYYVSMKQASCKEVGIESFRTDLPRTASREEVIGAIERYNVDDKVDGILLQLPLPDSIREYTQEILDHINPDKDVDGLTSHNLGRLLVNSPDAVYPCTPKGCMELLKAYKIDPKGKKALVLGRSTLVGKPIALMLNQANATVNMAHSKTENIADEVKTADIVVVAIGQPEYVKGEWLKPGAVVIDVGINSVYISEDGKQVQVNPNSSTQTTDIKDLEKQGYVKKLVGDVEFASASNIASLITPVPGGVGPMTVAMLLSNSFELYSRR